VAPGGRGDGGEAGLTAGWGSGRAAARQPEPAYRTISKCFRSRLCRSLINFRRIGSIDCGASNAR
jgi:hypothetical protein